MSTTKSLNESMHALVTPEFTGTHKEMIDAANYWITLIAQVRNIDAIVSFDNRASIVNQLEKEIAIMKAELENPSAVITTDGNGLPSMGQPAHTEKPPIEVEPPTNTINTDVAQQTGNPVHAQAQLQHESMIARLKANAGLNRHKKQAPLSKLLKG